MNEEQNPGNNNELEVESTKSQETISTDGNARVSRDPAKRNTIIAIIVAIIIVLAGIFYALYATNNLGPLSSLFTGHKAVAYVNGEKITQNELAARFDPVKQQIESTDLGTSTNKQQLIDSSRRQVLDNLINEKILLNQAHKEGTTVTDKQVEDQYNTMKQQFQAQSAGSVTSGSSSTSTPSVTFEDQLKLAGLTTSEYKTELRNQLIITDYLTKKLGLQNIQVSDEESKALYDQLVASAASSTGTSASDVPAYTDVKATLQARLKEQKAQQAVQHFVEQLRAGAQVKILI